VEPSRAQVERGSNGNHMVNETKKNDGVHTPDQQLTLLGGVMNLC